MSFLDANVFIYAYYKPKRELTEKEKQMKEHAKEKNKRRRRSNNNSCPSFRSCKYSEEGVINGRFVFAVNRALFNGQCKDC